MRPRSLDEVVGQEHLVGSGKVKLTINIVEKSLLDAALHAETLARAQLHLA